MIELPKTAQTLFDALHCKGDVDIDTLHKALFPGAKVREKRNQQQRLGPPIVRLNRRLVKHKLAVKPGALKGTYRLVTL